MLGLEAWKLGILVGGLILATVRQRQMMRRQFGTVLPSLPAALVGYIPGAVILWGSVAWLTRSSLAAIQAYSPASAVLLALGAVALGPLMPELAIGAAAVYTLWRPHDGLLAGWVLPLMVGYLASRAPGLSRDSDARFRREIGKLFQSSLGQPLPPLGSDRILKIAALGVALAPATAAAVLAVTSNRSATDNALLLCAGLLVSGQACVWFIAEDRLTRNVRRGSRRMQTVSMVLTVGLAGSPVGAAFLEMLRAPGRPLLVAVLLASAGPLSTVALTTTMRQASRRKNARGLRLAFLALSYPRQLVLGRGLFLFAVTGLFDFNFFFLASAAFVAASDAIVLVASLRFAIWPLQRADAVHILGLNERARADVFHGWAYDAILNRRKRPDLSLVEILTAEAMHAAQGSADPSQGMFTWDARAAQALTGPRALEWTDMADRSLELARSTASSITDPSRQKRFLDSIAAVEPQLYLVKASIFQFINWPEESVSAWSTAANMLDSQHRHLESALARTSAAIDLGLRLERRDEALRILAELQSTDLPSFVRRYALVVGATLLVPVDLDVRTEQLDMARKIPYSVREVMGALSKEQSIKRYDPRLYITAARLLKVLRDQEQMHLAMHWPSSASVDRKIPHFPKPLNFPARRETITGINLLNAGRAGAAERHLRKGMRAARQDAHPSWENLAATFLSYALIDQNRIPEAYEALTLALDGREGVQRLILSPEDQLSIAGRDIDLYDLGISILATVALGGVRGERWPDRPAVEALLLVERAKSRVLLRMLGEFAPPIADTEVSSLLAAERMAYEQYAQHRTDSSSAPESTISIGRASLREVDRLWDQLASTGLEGEEYVSLRRGDPADFEGIKAILDGEPQ